MKLLVDLTEMGVGDVSVDLGCGDVGVTEKSLNGAKVGAVHEEIGCERMTESMRGDVLSDAGGFGIFFDNALDRTGGQAAIVSRSIDFVEMTRIVKKESGKGIVANGKIFTDAIGGSFGDEDGAVFLTLPADKKFATVEIDGITVERDELRYP